MSDTNAPGLKTLWSAVMTGGDIVSLGYFLEGKGPRRSLLPAVRTLRTFWLSDSFAAQHPQVTAIIRSAADLDESKWRERKGFAAFKASPTRIGFVTDRGKAHPDLLNRKNAFTLSATPPSLLVTVNEACSSSGI